MEKKALRSEIKKRSAQLTSEYRSRASRQIAERVIHEPGFEKAETIFVYIATAEEPDTRAIIEAAWKAGKRVCVPKCMSRHIMKAYQISSFDQLAPQGPYQLMEPVVAGEYVQENLSQKRLSQGILPQESLSQERLPQENQVRESLSQERLSQKILPQESLSQERLPGEILPQEIDLVIVPCMSAGSDGRRLGHGAGFYDRYMSGRRMHRLCICFEALMDERIEMDDYDLYMDTVITENHTYNTHEDVQLAVIRHKEMEELMLQEDFETHILPGICQHYQNLIRKGSKQRARLLASGLLLARQLGVTRDEQLMENPAGKRTLKEGPAISISHSQDYTLLAWTNQGPIGLDIEDIPDPADERKARIRKLITSRHFPESYRKIYEQAQDKEECFTRLWTTLEAILKCKGTGFTDAYMEHQEEMELDRWRLQQSRMDNVIITIARR